MNTFATNHPCLLREDHQDGCPSGVLNGGSLLLAVADGMGGEAGVGLDNIAIVGLKS